MRQYAHAVLDAGTAIIELWSDCARQCTGLGTGVSTIGAALGAGTGGSPFSFAKNLPCFNCRHRYH